MKQLELSDEEHEALMSFLRRSIEADPYPLAPRLRPLKAILARLDPQPPATEPFPAPKRYPIPSSLLQKKRRR